MDEYWRKTSGEKIIVNDLDYFRNKIQWSMHFMQNLMPVSEKDYKKLTEGVNMIMETESVNDLKN